MILFDLFSMVYSGYTKQRILYLRRMGKTYTQIVASLGKEGHSVTKAGGT